MATVKAFIKVYKIDTPTNVRFRLRAGKNERKVLVGSIEELEEKLDFYF
jgi:hypothetical protein